MAALFCDCTDDKRLGMTTFKKNSDVIRSFRGGSGRLIDKDLLNVVFDLKQRSRFETFFIFKNHIFCYCIRMKLVLCL